MNARPLRGRAAVSTAVALALAMLGTSGLVACGGEGSAGKGDLRIGVLFPGTATARFGQFDKPLIREKLHELCPECQVQFAEGREDPAIQRQQFDSLLTRGVDVLILDAVAPPAQRSLVEAAHRAGIPVVAYDRLAEGPISGYVTFDGAKVGRLQAEELLKAMGEKGKGRQVVMMNGATTDPNAGWFKRGALSVLKGRVRIGKSYDTVEWRAENATANMTEAVSDLGANSIDGVLAANDTLATGVITALKDSGVSPLPPITGQDALLVAVRRLLTGEQYMTVYKAFKPEADAAATMAVALARGEKINGMATTTVDNSTTKHIPTVLLNPVSVTAGNIKDTLVKDGMYTIGQICTPELRSACDKAGLTR